MELKTHTLFTDANLVAYYRLEDVNDSKNSFNLTNNNSVTFTSAKFGNGANLGSSNTNKDLSVSNDLGITGGAITISLWVKLLAEITTGTWDLAYQIDDSTDVGYIIRYVYNSGSQIVTFRRVKQNVEGVNSNFTTGALGTSNFHHIVLVYDTTNIMGYVNGVASTPAATSGNGSGTNPDVFKIGSIGSNYSSVLIDDVGVWNRALTASEISQLYKESSGFFALL